MSHVKMILDFLEKGNKLSPIRALEEFGCYRLSARIHDLRKKGYNILRDSVSVKNRYGHKIEVSQYYLEP